MESTVLLPVAERDASRRPLASSSDSSSVPTVAATVLETLVRPATGVSIVSSAPIAAAVGPVSTVVTPVVIVPPPPIVAGASISNCRPVAETEKRVPIGTTVAGVPVRRTPPEAMVDFVAALRARPRRERMRSSATPAAESGSMAWYTASTDSSCSARYCERIRRMTPSGESSDTSVPAPNSASQSARSRVRYSAAVSFA